MRYLIFEDPVTNTRYPVLLCSHLDPSKVVVDGLRVASGGDVNIAPESRFTVQASESFRYSEEDQHLVGSALKGASQTEFRRRDPVMLFTMPGDSVPRKAYSVQELLDTPGFPEDVTWVSGNSPAFDKFFMNTPSGVRAKEKMLIDDMASYAASLKANPPGVSGTIAKDMAIWMTQTANIHLSTFDALGPPDLLKFKYDGVTGTVYWWIDNTETTNVMLEHKLSAMGYRVSKHVRVQPDDVADLAQEESPPAPKKPAKKKK